MDNYKRGLAMDVDIEKEVEIHGEIVKETRTSYYVSDWNGTHRHIPKSKVKAKKRTTIKVAAIHKPKGKAKVADLTSKWKMLENEGISAVKSLTEEEMCTMIRFASDRYYNTGESVVSDNVFDILKEYGQRTYPKNPCFIEIGAPTNKEKVALPYFMGSMEKIKPDTGALAKFVKKYPDINNPPM